MQILDCFVNDAILGELIDPTRLMAYLCFVKWCLLCKLVQPLVDVAIISSKAGLQNFITEVESVYETYSVRTQLSKKIQLSFHSHFALLD